MDPGLSDFWAMRDLAELSKGAFSQLPPWLEAAAMRAAALAAATGTLALITTRS
ncbi:Phox domain-containing isoform 1, partial [Haematococcus lacustris]